ncbi:anthranilate phosphoribosyltransferase [Eubacteriaceae bacterium ES2]|nr:anthranilate phosphoribosyltransferase [Eubacteriaceae bacterium ES2]
MIKEAIYKVVNGDNLSIEEAYSVMNEIMSGHATPAQIGAYLTGLRYKGETIEEITGSAMVMREKSIKISPEYDVLDIVGTGGDEVATFNISTISSLVIAAAGVPVAKHGNRSVSSKCGSADLLETLGVNIMLSAKESQKILKQIGICFMFAPTYHSSMKYAAPVRKEMGIRTIFNILGPLANPAGANMTLLGVYDENLVEPLAKVLIKLQVKSGLVVHGHDGLDEITLTDTTSVCEVNGDQLNSYLIIPEQLGLERCEINDLIGGDAHENAEIARAVLEGETGPKRDVVVMNSAFALYLAKKGHTLKECVKIAESAIDSKAALNKLNELISLSERFKTEGIA